jgi:hypothetical protein
VNRCVSLMAALAGCGVVLSISGCGGGSSSTQTTILPPSVITVSVSATTGLVQAGGTALITALREMNSFKATGLSRQCPVRGGGVPCRYMVPN